MTGVRLTKDMGAIYFRDHKGTFELRTALPMPKGAKHVNDIALITAAVAARCTDAKWLARQVKWFVGLRLSEATKRGVSVRLRARKAKARGGKA